MMWVLLSVAHAVHMKAWFAEPVAGQPPEVVAEGETSEEYITELGFIPAEESDGLCDASFELGNVLVYRFAENMVITMNQLRVFFDCFSQHDTEQRWTELAEDVAAEICQTEMHLASDFEPIDLKRREVELDYFKKKMQEDWIIAWGKNHACSETTTVKDRLEQELEIVVSSVDAIDEVCDDLYKKFPGVTWEGGVVGGGCNANSSQLCIFPMGLLQSFFVCIQDHGTDPTWEQRGKYVVASMCQTKEPFLTFSRGIESDKERELDDFKDLLLEDWMSSWIAAHTCSDNTTIQEKLEKEVELLDPAEPGLHYTCGAIYVLHQYQSAMDYYDFKTLLECLVFDPPRWRQQAHDLVAKLCQASNIFCFDSTDEQISELVSVVEGASHLATFNCSDHTTMQDKFKQELALKDPSKPIDCLI